MHYRSKFPTRSSVSTKMLLCETARFIITSFLKPDYDIASKNVRGLSTMTQ